MVDNALIEKQTEDEATTVIFHNIRCNLADRQNDQKANQSKNVTQIILLCQIDGALRILQQCVLLTKSYAEM